MDLLAPANDSLRVREDGEVGVYLEGATERVAGSLGRALATMGVGERNRHTAATRMNARSSRSHSVFRVVIESKAKGDEGKDKDGKDKSAVRVSTLYLVDLAGSERVKKAETAGLQLKEGGSINKSLMHLGMVISKLSERAGKKGKAEAGFIPYRDSVLTRILQPALGGNSRTAVICCVTPAEAHVDETVSTLRFASNAKKVKNRVKVNTTRSAAAAVLKRQASEIAALKQQLAAQGGGAADSTEVEDLRNQLLVGENERKMVGAALEEEREAAATKARQIAEQQRKIAAMEKYIFSFVGDNGSESPGAEPGGTAESGNTAGASGSGGGDLNASEDELRRRKMALRKRRMTWAPARAMQGEDSSRARPALLSSPRPPAAAQSPISTKPSPPAHEERQRAVTWGSAVQLTDAHSNGGGGGTHGGDDANVKAKGASEQQQPLMRGGTGQDGAAPRTVRFAAGGEAGQPGPAAPAPPTPRQSADGVPATEVAAVGIEGEPVEVVATKAAAADAGGLDDLRRALAASQAQVVALEARLERERGSAVNEARQAARETVEERSAEAAEERRRNAVSIRELSDGRDTDRETNASGMRAVHMLMDGMQRRLEDLESRAADKHNDSTEHSANTVAEMAKQVSQLGARIGAMESRAEGTAAAAEVAQRVSSLEGAVAEQVSQLDTRIGAMESRAEGTAAAAAAEVAQRVSSLEGAMAERLEALEERLAARASAESFAAAEASAASAAAVGALTERMAGFESWTRDEGRRRQEEDQKLAARAAQSPPEPMSPDRRVAERLAAIEARLSRVGALRIGEEADDDGGGAESMQTSPTQPQRRARRSPAAGGMGRGEMLALSARLARVEAARLASAAGAADSRAAAMAAERDSAVAALRAYEEHGGVEQLIALADESAASRDDARAALAAVAEGLEVERLRAARAEARALQARAAAAPTLRSAEKLRAQLRHSDVARRDALQRAADVSDRRDALVAALGARVEGERQQREARAAAALGIDASPGNVDVVGSESAQAQLKPNPAEDRADSAFVTPGARGKAVASWAPAAAAWATVERQVSSLDHVLSPH